ncbi:CoA transferase [Alcaligenaceae bacterium]|nr:CoA transferase [Alcaligenaceae bacterium]
MSIKPLVGTRILDFSKVLAGPLCTQALTDLGAEVIKIESLEGDDTRGWPPFREGDGAVFLATNRGKRSIAIDLKSEGGKEIVRKLVREADVVVESFGTGVAQRLGIDYEALKALNDKLVYCSISGFGRTGPLAHAKGYDMILQAFTGMCSIMGEPGSGPVRAPFSPVDQGTGMHATSAILAALLERGRTGRGCLVEVSLFETGVAFLGYMFQAYWERGTEPERFGCAHESLCPYEAFNASDKSVLIGVASEPLWRRFCEVVQLDDMKDDPRFKTNSLRVQNREATLAPIREVVAKHPAAYWVDLLVGNGIPCTQINSFSDVLNHPHTLDSGIIMHYESPTHGKLNAIGPPVKYDGVRSEPTQAPAKLGEHTHAVLAELGYTDQEIGQLQSVGAIATV